MSGAGAPPAAARPGPAAPPGPARRAAAALPWFLPALAYAGLIFWLSHQPNPLPSLTARVSDKLLHAAEYAGLAGLLALGLVRLGGVARRRALVLCVALAAAYGATDELHQAFVPNRDASLLDWASDSLGALVGGILAVRFLRRRDPEGSIRA